MKKKVALLVFIFTFVFSSGFALAASLHGTYKGHSIVKLFIDGKEAKTSVPAIVIDGTTLVPLRVISEQLGQEISWDGKSQSVYVGKQPDYEITQQEGLLLSGIDVEVTTYGSVAITGEVKNVSGRKINNWIDITVSLLDKNGKTVNTGEGSVAPLEKDESRTFYVEIYDVDPSAEGYEILAKEER